MSDLEKAESVDETPHDREDVLNRIIAAGLNSLTCYTSPHSDGPNKNLLNTFAEKSFDRIIPCFDMLDERIQIYVFKPHKEEFLEFINQKNKEREA